VGELHGTEGRAFDAAARPRRLLTICGWSPQVRVALGARQLRCGCLVGAYQHRNGSVVTAVDWRANGCAHTHHQPNVIVADARTSFTSSRGWAVDDEVPEATLRSPGRRGRSGASIAAVLDWLIGLVGDSGSVRR
jgi:hypothetical protein